MSCLQIFNRGGLKDENIVVFMHNDTAKSELNSRPGVIINHLNGSGVYVACLRWGCQVHWTHFLDSLMEKNSIICLAFTWIDLCLHFHLYAYLLQSFGQTLALFSSF